MPELAPRVSVVVPAFNAAKHIGLSLKSVLDQSLRELEVVVVDDGSTDATAAVVERIEDPRVLLLRQSNRGQSAAINAGAAHAKAACIKLLDADDWLNPRHLEAQLHALKGRTDRVACCGWAYFVDDPTKVGPKPEATRRDYLDPLEWLLDSLEHDEGMMGGWRWLIPRDLWDKVGGFDERLSLNNDFHFSIRLLLASRGVCYAPGAIYAYRKGMDAALSASGGRQAMESALLTTQLGTDLLLQREDTDRVRRLCADRFQEWLFRFYPEFPDLADQAERRIQELGGSERRLHGGRVLRSLLPLIGWRNVRRLQAIAHRGAWRKVLELKARRRLRRIREQAGEGPGHAS